VKDADENVVFPSQILEIHGQPHAVGRDGTEALAAMQKERSDVVVLGLFLPPGSGIAVHVRMQEDPNVATAPVIVIAPETEVTGVKMRAEGALPRENHGDDVAPGLRRAGADHRRSAGCFRDQLAAI